MKLSEFQFSTVVFRFEIKIKLLVLIVVQIFVRKNRVVSFLRLLDISRDTEIASKNKKVKTFILVFQNPRTESYLSCISI